MSRSGYSDDFGDDDPLALGRWRAAVASAINGKRGQEFLRDLAATLDAMPEKKLTAYVWDEAVTGMPFALKGGEVCALGAVARARGIDLTKHDPDDDSVCEIVAKQLNIATAMAREIVYVNDEYGHYKTTPEQRWLIVRDWVRSNLANT